MADTFGIGLDEGLAGKSPGASLAFQGVLHVLIVTS
jgi:hypothetical protein